MVRMRILQVNKFMYRRAGAEAYMLDLGRMLAASGDEVAYFGMQHPENIQTPWNRYFVNQINFDRSEGMVADAHKVAHMLWSTEAARKFRRLLDAFKPDIVHAHNIYHQISPSILPECRRRGIPVVLTAHDYHLMSPNYVLLTRGKPCGPCLGNSFFRTIAYNCLDNHAKSFAGAVEQLLHRALRVYEQALTRIICPSRFMLEMLSRFGWPRDRLTVLPNPVSMPAIAAGPRGREIVYAGRLSPEKGVSVLLAAAREFPDIPFHLFGDGPERGALERAAPSQVRFFGFKPPEAVRAALAHARLAVVPSVWYENFPYAVLEPMSVGTPVIASRIGGIPEIIRDGANGLLAVPGSAASLVDRIRILYYDEALGAAFGKRAAADVRSAYDPTHHLRAIRELYGSLVRH